MYYRGIIVVVFNQGLVEKQLFITDERVTLNKYISNKQTCEHELYKYYIFNIWFMITKDRRKTDVRSKQYDADNQIRRHHTDCNIPVVISHYTIIINWKCDLFSIDFGRYHHHINDV